MTPKQTGLKIKALLEMRYGHLGVNLPGGLHRKPNYVKKNTTTNET